MAPNKRFGQLLDEGISSVAKRQQKTIAAVEAEIAERLGYSSHTVQHWRRGNLPSEVDQVEQIVRYCVQGGRVDRTWAHSVLLQAGHPESSSVLHDLFEEMRAQRHVFLCYLRHAEPDESMALHTAQALSRHYHVHFDQIKTVDVDWGKRIQAELQSSDYIVIFLSAAATSSEVMRAEIQLAYELHSQQGRPELLPICLNCEWPLPEPLKSYLESLNWTFCNTPEQTPKLVEELKAAIDGGSLPLRSEALQGLISTKESPVHSLPQPLPQSSWLEQPGGTMDLDSSFYIEREEDRLGQEAIGGQGETITIKGARQMGKSSLLIRLKAAAEAIGKRVVFLDFQLFNLDSSDADRFFRQFCALLTYRLKAVDRVEEFWSIPLPNPFRCTEYVGRHLLAALDTPLLLAMDEVDGVFDTTYRTDFFGMLRSWHNSRAFDPIWKKLDLVLVTSTEPYYFIDQLNQSPFNVGTLIELQPFIPEQVAELNRRHNFPLDAQQIRQLATLLNGHPYLVRRALYLVATGRITPANLFDHATDEQGPFIDHLRSLLMRLHSRQNLVEGLRQVLQEQRCPNELVFFRLRGAGLVRREENRVLPTSPLYTEYFSRLLL